MPELPLLQLGRWPPFFSAFFLWLKHVLGRNGRCFCSRAWCSPSQDRLWRSADKLVTLQTAFQTVRLPRDCHSQKLCKISNFRAKLSEKGNIHSFSPQILVGCPQVPAPVPKCLLLWGALQVLWRGQQLAENPIPSDEANLRECQSLHPLSSPWKPS